MGCAWLGIVAASNKSAKRQGPRGLIPISIWLLGKFYTYPTELPPSRRRVRGGELQEGHRRADPEDEEEGRARQGQQEQEGWVWLNFIFLTSFEIGEILVPTRSRSARMSESVEQTFAHWFLSGAGRVVALIGLFVSSCVLESPLYLIYDHFHKKEKV